MVAVIGFLLSSLVCWEHMYRRHRTLILELKERGLPIRNRLYDFNVNQNNQHAEIFIRENPDNPKNQELAEASKWVKYSKFMTLSIPFVVLFVVNSF